MDLPALLGGPPLRPNGPPPWPPWDPAVIEAVNRALQDSTWGTYHGPHTETLARSLRDAWHVEHILLCGSGTYAVELGLRALGVGTGTEVVLASYDFPGNFLAVHAVGAMPVLVDVEPHNWNLSIARVAEALGPSTKAVVASHLHGGIVPMRELTDLARQHGVAVLEDAAQCPGATIQGKPAGTWGDAGVVSFGGSKLLSAGRGGALLTNRADVGQRARPHWFRGNVVSPLSEIQAAALVPQVQPLPARRSLRAENVRRLLDLLHDVSGLRPLTNAVAETVPDYYKLGLQYDELAFGLSRDRFVAALRAEGIALSAGFAAQHVGRSPKRFRASSTLCEAEKAHRGVVVLHHPVLLGAAEDLVQVANAVHKVHAHAERLANATLAEYAGEEGDFGF